MKTKQTQVTNPNLSLASLSNASRCAASLSLVAIDNPKPNLALAIYNTPDLSIATINTSHHCLDLIPYYSTLSAPKELKNTECLYKIKQRKNH
jgi:hypothetical protein